MADAGSALESQQAIAATIPYKNIDANQKSLGLALGAFFHAAEISKQRQQLENALLSTQMLVGEQARWHDIEMKNMEQSAAMRMYGMGLREELMNGQLNLGAQRLALAKDTADQKTQKDADTIQSISSLMRDFSSAEPGTPEFHKNYFDTLAKPTNARGLETVIGHQEALNLANQHNKSSSRIVDKINADMREFGLEVNNRVWRGEMSPNKVDLAPIEHPEMWKDQYVNKKTGEPGGPDQAFTKDSTGKLIRNDDWKPTGSKFLGIPLMDPNTGLAKKDANGQIQYKEYTTMSVPELNGMRKRYQDLLKRKGEIPQQIVTNEVAPVRASTSYNMIDPSTAKNILIEAGGDKDKARQIAKDRGYDF